MTVENIYEFSSSHTCSQKLGPYFSLLCTRFSSPVSCRVADIILFGVREPNVFDYIIYPKTNGQA